MYYDITWCGFAGQKPPAQYVEILDAVCRARDAALEFVRERFEAGEPLPRLRGGRRRRATSFAKAGYGELFLHRTGHSIGTDDVHGNGVNIDNLETRDDRHAGARHLLLHRARDLPRRAQMAVRTEIDVFIKPDGEVEVCGPIQKDLILIG